MKVRTGSVNEMGLSKKVITSSIRKKLFSEYFVSKCFFYLFICHLKTKNKSVSSRSTQNYSSHAILPIGLVIVSRPGSLNDSTAMENINLVDKVLKIIISILL